MSKVTKRDTSKIDKEISLLLDSCVNSSLKPRCRDVYSNGGGIPLTAWMAGVPDKYPSKIIAVTSGLARYPYRTYGAGSFHVFLRLVKGRHLTDIQHVLLSEAVGSHYRGKDGIDFDDYCAGMAMYPTRSFSVFCEIRKLIWSKRLSNVPLNFLLSEKLTDLILMKCLYSEVMK